MPLRIELPLDDEQAQAVVLAAEAFGVEPWEMGAHVLQARRWPSGSERAAFVRARNAMYQRRHRTPKQGR